MGEATHELVILFGPTRANGWRAFVLAHPPDMSMRGFDEHGAAFGLPQPDLDDLVHRLREARQPPLYRVRGASNGGVRISFAAKLAPTVREWLDDMIATGTRGGE
jgi:hypothetical protein